MNLTEQPEIVTWPETYYVFVEKVGPFPETAPQAWQEMHRLVAALSASNSVTAYFSLYKMGPKVYRAGVGTAAPPQNIPAGLRYERFPGGKYSRFVLTGPYSLLGQATGRVMQLIGERKIPLRDDYYIENYVNDPRTTPEDRLISQILVPTA